MRGERVWFNVDVDALGAVLSGALGLGDDGQVVRVYAVGCQLTAHL